MALISNGTTIASGGSLSVAATPPTTLNAVGTYAGLKNDSSSSSNPGSTISGSGLKYASFGGNTFNASTPSGTWRQMGHRNTDNDSRMSTVFVRIS